MTAAKRLGHTRVEAYGARLLRLGVILGALGTPAAFLSAGGNAFGPPKAAVLALAASLVATGFALDTAASRTLAHALRRSRILAASAALVVLSCASVLVAPNARQSLLGSFPDYRGLAATVALAVVGAGAVAHVRRDGGPRGLLRAASGVLLAIALVGVGERFGLPPASLKLEGSQRIISTVGNAANLGVLVALLLPLAAWVALRDGSRAWRAVAGAGVAWGVIVLVWTLSRGAWLGVAAGAVVAVALLAASRRAATAPPAAARPGAAPRPGAPSSAAARRPRILATALLAAGIVAVVLMPQAVHRATTVLDGTSGTAQWRVSTWRSSAKMMLDRPVLGFGVNGFRFAYPAFQEPGQSDGRYGYVPIEAAHNLEADTVVSLGLLGLVALLALTIETATTLVRRSLAPGADRTQAVAVAASLAGGFVALQFHYVTLDTGPLLAVLLAIAATFEIPAEEPRASRAARSTPGVAAPPAPAAVAATRVLAAALALAFAVATVAAVALVVADREGARAVALARAGAPWEQVAAAAKRAERLAPWEAAVSRAGGRAGTARLTTTYEPEAARDGLAAYDRALALSPRDPVLVNERATLLLLAGVGSHDTASLEAALDGFEAAAAMDPNTGLPLVGQARVAIVLGDTEAGIALLERSVELSPLYAPAWDDLAKAYRLLGREAEALRAEERLAELRE